MEALVQLGVNIKRLRKERKLTLQAIAERTGLTAGLLSKIENYRTIPSLPALLAIGKALQVDCAELFAGMQIHAKPRWTLIRPTDQRVVPREDSQGMEYRMILEMPLAEGNLQVMLVTVQPGATRETVESEGTEIVYVLAGKLQFHLGDQTAELAAGDTLLFDGTLPHLPVNPYDTDAMLLVCYCLKS